MKLDEINICQVVLFNLYTIYNKHEMIKNGNQTRQKPNNFTADCMCSKYSAIDIWSAERHNKENCYEMQLQLR